MATNFADMPIGKRNRWIAWAQSHDWESCDGKAIMAGTVGFHNAQEMRNWAGY